jgi:RNA polymerase sigma-70 factor (ECF subfamily)
MSGQINSIRSHNNTYRSNQNDLDLWFRIRRGDVVAFASIFEKYYTRLYQFSTRFIPDSQAAENVVQDFFVNLWIHREKHNIQSNFKSYIFTSIKNRALNYLNQTKQNTPTGLNEMHREETSENPEQDFLNKEIDSAVYAAIERLPKKCRQIYLMKRYDNLKYTEIAEILGISVNTVKTQIKRALMLLQKQLAHLLNPLLN